MGVGDVAAAALHGLLDVGVALALLGQVMSRHSLTFGGSISRSIDSVSS